MTATLTWQPFRLTLRSPFAAAHGALSERHGLLVRLRLRGDEEGLGEASPLPSYAGGSVEETAAALGQIAGACRGLTIDEMWQSVPALDGFSQGSTAAALCGFETALADILARRDGLPLCRWLARDSGREVAPGLPLIPVNAVIDAAEPGVAAAQACELARRGYSTFKVKVTTDVDGACARLQAVREAIGASAALRIDANGAWDSEAVALAALERLSAFGLALCEQPLAAAAGLERMAFVGRHSPVPLAVDEGCRSLSDLSEVVRAGAAGTVVVKPMVTGLREALAMLEFARQQGFTAIVTTTFDSGVGTALAGHLAALLPDPVPACGLATLEHVERDFVSGAPNVERGWLKLAAGPGLSVTMNEDAFAALCTGPATEARL